MHQPDKNFFASAVVICCVTNHLPLQPIPTHQNWNNLLGLQFTDPSFGQPGRIDLLLGVDFFFTEVVLHDWRGGLPGSPVADETHFG